MNVCVTIYSTGTKGADILITLSSKESIARAKRQLIYRIGGQ